MPYITSIYYVTYSTIYFVFCPFKAPYILNCIKSPCIHKRLLQAAEKTLERKKRAKTVP